MRKNWYYRMMLSYSFVVQMDKVIATLSPVIQEGWKNDYQHLFVELAEKVETFRTEPRSA